ncbi:MAG: class I SAM-dependent methyltransferase [Planctomycetia bacterium]|nr:class I SAM-dependent methyltransferase [Planctomycetia bacterium]
MIDCVARNTWRWARTMPTIPHEYIVRGRCRLTDAEFERFVHLQRNYGTHEKWGTYNFPYLYVDGYKYWTMGAPVTETTIINRQKVFQEFDAVADRYDALLQGDYFMQETAGIAEILDGELSGRILEIGCGTGMLIELQKQFPMRNLAVDSQFYVGVDPSKKMLDVFSAKFPEFQNRLRNKAFEECTFRKPFDVVVALRGAMSYVMKPYIPKIGEMVERYFLMFYAPNSVPTIFRKLGEKTHYFKYAESEIQEMLPGVRLMPFRDYLIARK